MFRAPSLPSSFMTYLAFYIIIIHDALNLLYHHRSSSLSLSSQVLSYVCINTLYWGNVCLMPHHHTFVVIHHCHHHSWHVQPYTLSSFMMYSTFYSSSFIIIITFMLSAITCVHQHFILGQCVYLCCHTSCLRLHHCHHHSWHVQPSTSLSFTTCYHRSWSLSLSSQVSSYASALYQHQGAEQSPRYHPFKALYRQALQSPVTAGTPLKPCIGRHPKAQ